MADHTSCSHLQCLERRDLAVLCNGPLHPLHHRVNDRRAIAAVILGDSADALRAARNILSSLQWLQGRCTDAQVSLSAQWRLYAMHFNCASA